MEKYIRTNDEIFEVIEKKEDYFYCKSKNLNICTTVNINDITKQADTIEELIQDGDMLYIHDLYPDVVLVVEGNIKPFGYNNEIKLKEWLEYKFTEFDLYIKQPNEDYHKVAEKKQCVKLVLL